MKQSSTLHSLQGMSDFYVHCFEMWATFFSVNVLKNYNDGNSVVGTS